MNIEQYEQEIRELTRKKKASTLAVNCIFGVAIFGAMIFVFSDMAEAAVGLLAAFFLGGTPLAIVVRNCDKQIKICQIEINKLVELKEKSAVDKEKCPYCGSKMKDSQCPACGARAKL